MRYAVGDKPVTPLVVVPTRDDEPVVLTDAVAVITVDGVALATTIVDDEVRGVFVEPFEQSGILPVVVTVTWEDGVETFVSESIVVEVVGGPWHSIVTAAAEWASNLSDVQAFTVLSSARVAVEQYGWTGREDDVVPLRVRNAQLMQARSIYNAALADPAQRDADGQLFFSTPFPLDHNIRQLLRPRRGVPVAG